MHTAIWALLGVVCAIICFYLGHVLFVPPCGRDLVGKDGACKQCFEHSQCGSGFLCSPAGACVECVGNTDCVPGHVCNVHTGTCGATCTIDSDCDGGACAGGVCVGVPVARPYVPVDAVRSLDAASCENNGYLWGVTPASDEISICHRCDPHTYVGEYRCDGFGRVVSCLQDKHCGSDFTCNNTTGMCVPAWDMAQLSEGARRFSRVAGRLSASNRGLYFVVNDVDGVGLAGNGQSCVMLHEPSAPTVWYILFRSVSGWVQLLPSPTGEVARAVTIATSIIGDYKSQSSGWYFLTNTAEAPINSSTSSLTRASSLIGGEGYMIQSVGDSTVYLDPNLPGVRSTSTSNAPIGPVVLYM